MASITKEELRTEIAAQLKGADLKTVSAKKIRQALEKKFDEDLTDRKKEIDDIINDVINEEGSGDEDGKDEENGDGSEEEEEEEEEVEEKPKKKRGAAPKRAASDSEEASDDGGSEEEYSPKKKAPRAAPKKRGRPKKADSDEEDWRAAKKAPAKRGPKKAGSGYTKQCTLSEPLAKIMGQPEMARHEVIKKMWAYIKENNLYDPKNKQFAICDDTILPVIGVKRFRTFGMMKYLKDHIK